MRFKWQIDTKKLMGILYWILGGVAVVVLAVVTWLVYMFMEFASALEALELP
jgi:hypothetical protein